jgi:broad specificity phosphatase PhoE
VILLARHGNSVDNGPPRRFSGHRDTPLSELGREQSRALAEAVADEDLEALWTSPLIRARETAEIVGERLGLPVVIDADLREKNWGSWEGLTSDERLNVEYEGETTEDHRARILGAVGRIVERHPAQRVVVVTHGGSLRRIQAAVSGVALPVIENCAVWAVAHENGSFRSID